ncbi:hypothetical protein G6F60_015647 [Rhizopus arrhizus]|nr:hypothetical protein G6F60_015647 [Rhizopus arrhizus]
MATAEGRQHPRGLRVDEVLGHADAYGGLHRGTGHRAGCGRHRWDARRGGPVRAGGARPVPPGGAPSG